MPNCPTLPKEILFDILRSSPALPEEILFEIFARLPADSAARCRCLSKSWRALLSQPKFIRAHLHCSTIRGYQSLLFTSYAKRAFAYASLDNAHNLFDEIPLSPNAHNLLDRIPLYPKRVGFAGRPEFWFRVHCSCDGLLLVGAKFPDLLLVNPITREVKELPGFPLDPRSQEEPLTMKGLGYDRVSCDYKVLVVAYLPVRFRGMYGKVYSLKRGCWEAEICDYDYEPGDWNSSGAFVNGCVHWVVTRIRDGNCVIVGFDLAEKVFREVPPPPHLANGYDLVAYRPVELGGELCLYGQIDDRTRTDAWLMKEYGVKESWVKLGISEHDAEAFVLEIQPFCWLGRDETMLLVEDKIYNLKEGTSKNIGFHGKSEGFAPETTFVESLIPLNSTDEVGRE